MPESNTVQVFWEVEGGSDLLAPDGFSRVDESIISGKIRVGKSHSHYLESRFRSDAYLWKRNGKAYSIKGKIKFLSFFWIPSSQPTGWEGDYK